MLHSFWKWLRKTNPRTIRHKSSRWLRPAAEALEDRTLLSITANLAATVAITSSSSFPISARGATIQGTANFLIVPSADPQPIVVTNNPPPTTKFSLSLTLPADMDILLDGVAPGQFIASKSDSVN